MEELPQHVEVSDDFSACDAVIRDVYARAGHENPFLESDWLKLWWAHFGGKRSLHLLVIKQGGAVIGVAPFFRVELPLLRTTEFRLLGQGMSSYLDMVCLPGTEERVAEAVLGHFKQLGYPAIVSFYDINDRFSTCHRALITRASGGSFEATVRRLYPCPLVDLSVDFSEFVRRRRDRKSLYNLRRAERRLNRLGLVHLSELSDSSRVSELFPRLQRLHSERFRTTVNPLLRGQRGAFLAEAIQRFVGRSLSLSILELDGVIVSFVIGFRMGSTFIDYAPAFDPALAVLSIGQIHLMRLMEQKAHEGIICFDLSKGEAVYKGQWATDESSSYSIRFGVNLTQPAKRYFLATDRLQQGVVLARSRGYSEWLKRWLARALSVPNLFIRRNSVSWREISIHERMNRGSGVPWSYHQIADIPVSARRVIVDLLVRLDADGLSVRRDKGSRQILLWTAGGSGYEIRY